MITNYNNYINKEDEIIKEKLEINLKKLIDTVKEKINLAKSSVVYSNVTYDNKPIKVGDNYYALFTTTDDKDEPQYSIGKVEIKDKVEKTLKTGGKNHTVYVYKLLSLDPKLLGQVKTTTDESGKQVPVLNKDGKEVREKVEYKLYKTDLGEKKLLGTNQINGFYLYANDKTSKDLGDILKRFNLEGQPNVQEPIDTSNVEVGNIYSVEYKGKTAKFGVLAKNDDQFNVTDMDSETNNVFWIKNIKIIKLLGDLYEKYKEKFDKFKLDNFTNADEYTKLPEEEKIKYIENKGKKLQEFRDHIIKNILNYGKEGDEFYDQMNSIKNNTKGILENYKKRIKQLKKSTKKDTEVPVDDEAQVQIDAIDKSEAQAKPLQAKAQAEKEAKAKKLGDTGKPKETVKKNPIKQKKTPTGTPESDMVKEPQKELVQQESFKFKKFSASNGTSK